MDFITLNIVISLISGTMIMAAVVYMLIYILGSFSSRSGTMSLRVVFLSLLYFFGSTIPIVLGVEWLMSVARLRVQGGEAFNLYIGASALALCAVLHFFCGFLTIFLYVRGQQSQGTTFRQALDSIRARLRSKSKN